MQSFHSPVTSCLLGGNIFHNTLFSNKLNLHSSLNVKDQTSNPQKTTSKIIIRLFENLVTYFRKNNYNELRLKIIPVWNSGHSYEIDVYLGELSITNELKYQSHSRKHDMYKFSDKSIVV